MEQCWRISGHINIKMRLYRKQSGTEERHIRVSVPSEVETRVWSFIFCCCVRPKYSTPHPPPTPILASGAFNRFQMCCAVEGLKRTIHRIFFLFLDK